MSPIRPPTPGVSLGIALGVLAKAGHDKLTFLADDEIAGLRGLGRAAHRREHRQARAWASCPSTSSRSGAVGVYGQDRAFVRLALAGAPDSAGRDALAAALEADGHPVIRITIADPIDLGAEFVRWEVATAIAGAVLGIDPFDQPNVEEAKQLTRDVLARAERGEPLTVATEPLASDRRGQPVRRHGHAPHDRRTAT